MAIIDNIHEEFKPYAKSLCSFITKIISDYEIKNKDEYGLLENINYITMAINNSILRLMTPETKEIIDRETKNNLILFNQLWTFDYSENNPDSNFDMYDIIGCISKTPFDIYAKTEDEFSDSFYIHTDIKSDSSYEITFGCGHIAFQISNIKIQEKDFANQLFLFVSSCVMNVRKLFAIQIAKSVDDKANMMGDDFNFDIINDNNVIQDIFKNMSTILKEDTYGSLFYNSIRENDNIADSTLIPTKNKSLLITYNNDDYLIPTLKKYMEDIAFAESKDQYNPEHKAEITIDALESKDVIINKVKFDNVSIDKDTKSALINLFKELPNFDDLYMLNAILLVDADESNTNILYNTFPLLMIYDYESEYSIISSYNMIADNEIREPFEKVQNYLIQTYIRNGLDLNFVDSYEKKFNDLGIMDEVKEAINNDEYIDEEEDEFEENNKTDLRQVKKNIKDNKTKNKIDYEYDDSFSIIKFGELIEDKLDEFFKEIETQLQLDISDYKNIHKALYDLSTCTIREYYSSDNVIDFDYIGEAISSDSFIITISSNKIIIDSIIVFFDDDSDKYIALRIGDRFGQYCPPDDREKFFKYYRITESNINLNVTYKGGSFNLALDQLCDYLKMSKSFNNTTKIRHDISTYVLSVISNIFIRKYIYESKGLSNEYNNPNHNKYMDRFDTYNTSKIISCFENYVDNHLIDINDIDNMLNVFNFVKDYNNKSNCIELENESSKIKMHLFDNTYSFIRNSKQIICKDSEPYLFNPKCYFSLENTTANKFIDNNKSYNYLLSIDSLGDKSIQDFNKEMVNILKYTKMCIEDNNNSKTTKRKTNRK